MREINKNCNRRCFGLFQLNGGMGEVGEGVRDWRIKNIMTENELLQSMLNLTRENSQNEKENQSIKTSLERAGIAESDTYYNKAFSNIEQALKKKGDSEAVHFWEQYQFELCKRLVRTESNEQKKIIKESINTIKAILYAMRA